MSNRTITTLVLSLNGAYLTALFGFMAVRVLAGLSPIPEGYGPFVMGSTGVVPVACIGLGNFLRLRRDA